MGINFILVYRQLSLKKITYSRLSLLIVLLKPSHHCLLFSYTTWCLSFDLIALHSFTPWTLWNRCFFLPVGP